MPADDRSPLTSLDNPKVKYMRALQARARNRRKEAAFVAEGVRLLEEALQTDWGTQFVFYTADLDARAHQVVEGFTQKGVEALPVSPAVMRAVSDTQTPQGVLAVLPMTPLPMPDQADFVLILDGVRDPGNLGTLLRTALAAGCDAVWLPPGVVDAYSPKVVRAAMGAHFRLPIQFLSWDEIRARAAALALTLFVADSTGGPSYTRADFTRPLGLILGGEAHGAGEQAWALNPQGVHIPMPGRAESLNAAIAGAILLFEVPRQRADRSN